MNPSTRLADGPLPEPPPSSSSRRPLSSAGRGGWGLAPAAPALVAGKYTFVARLGTGGTGEVHLAVMHGPSHFRKLCVVKRLRDGAADVPHSRHLFSKEGCVAARLNHPNVVQTYEASEENGVPYLSMEYLEGQTLRSVLAASQSAGVLPDFSLWVRVVADALAGLHHAHELKDFDGSPLGLIHRDVSPHNIFVTYEGRVCLIDFGAAKLSLRAPQVDCRTLTGKLGYMAPEYIAGGRIDRRADVFSMGVVLWEALAGRKMPNNGLTPSECCRTRPRVNTVERRVPESLANLVAKALEVDPDRRYATAFAMREDLEDWLEKAGPKVRQDDLGAFVQAYFADERETLEATIRASVQAVPKVFLMGAPSDAQLEGHLDDADVLPASPSRIRASVGLLDDEDQGLMDVDDDELERSSEPEPLPLARRSSHLRAPPTSRSPYTTRSPEDLGGIRRTLPGIAGPNTEAVTPTSPLRMPLEASQPLPLEPAWRGLWVGAVLLVLASGAAVALLGLH